MDLGLKLLAGLGSCFPCLGIKSCVCLLLSIVYLCVGIYCLQLKSLMVVGIDSYHDSAKKGRSVGGIVCSLNQKLTRYYSGCTFQMQAQELVDGACIRLRGKVVKLG